MEHIQKNKHRRLEQQAKHTNYQGPQHLALPLPEMGIDLEP